MNIKAGFSKTDLSEILPGSRFCEMPVSARGIYLAGRDFQSFFLVTDFMDFDFQAVTFLQKAVAAGLPENTQIHIMTTHNHGATPWSQLNTARFAELACACAKQSVESCQMAKVRFAQGVLDRKISFTRRVFVPEVDGSFTCFYGVDSTDTGNASAFVKSALENLVQGSLTFSASGDVSVVGERSFPAGDPEISILEFWTLNDLPLGNIVRFAAHAVCCNLPDWYSSDFPGYLREYLESSLGGISVFMNGPCAELAPVIRKKSPETGRNMAEVIAAHAVRLLEDTEFRLLEKFSDTLWEIPLPIRKELKDPGKTESFKPASTKDLREMKHFLEREYFQETLPFLRGICYNGISEPGDEIVVTTALLRLNDVNLLFFSGETFSETAGKITARFPGKKWITCTEHGRTAMYIPPEEEYFRGGYEPLCAAVSPEGENSLRQQMIFLLQKQFTEKY